jgi:hypothetical protein
MGAQQPRELPLPFSPEMMRAALAGRKRVTRRVARPQWPKDVIPKEHSSVPGLWLPYSPEGKLRNEVEGSRKNDCGIYCPYGSTGTHYYLREHFRFVMDRVAVEYVADGTVWEPEHPTLDFRVWWGEGVAKHGRNLRPPMFLPKFASRQWAECVSIRLELLHAITGPDAFAEGITLDGVHPASLTWHWARGIEKFMDLWDRINGNREGCGWTCNPWVFRVEFRLLEGK